MFDYSQLPLSEDGHKNWDKIFTPLSIEIMTENAKDMMGKNCHYSQGGKYTCICKSNICKKDVKK